MTNDEYEAERFAVLLLPGWRHKTTGKVHIRRDCRAVQFYAANMTPILVRLDDENEAMRAFDPENRCTYCFKGYTLH